MDAATELTWLLKQKLLGRPCVAINAPGLALITLEFEGGQSLHLFEPWRITLKGALVGSGSEGTKLDSVKSAIETMLVGQIVSEVLIEPPWLDLHLQFASGAMVECFQESDCYENWNMTNTRGLCLVAGLLDDHAIFPET